MDFQQQYSTYWRSAHVQAYETRRIIRYNVLTLCDGIEDCVDLYEVHAIMGRVIKIWRDKEVCWGEFERNLVTKLTKMVDHISHSPYIMINFENDEEIALSRAVLGLFREILGDDLELEFAMDCSRDEEIALALARADEDFIGFPPR